MTMTITENNQIEFAIGKSLGVRIIIEGVDGVGKDTFINNFKAYINGDSIVENGRLIAPAYHAFGGKNFLRFHTDALVGKGGKHAGKIIYEELADEKLLQEIERHPKRFHHGYQYLQSKWGNVFSNTSIHPSETTVQSRNFIEALNKGSITDQDFIAEEYLQVHWDLENHCKELAEVFDVIIMNRSLVSYYAMQIKALGYEKHHTNWEKLWNYSDQKNGIFIHLTMEEDALRERLAKRQEKDFRGDIENIYTQKFKEINEGFEEMKSKDSWLKVYTVDTSGSASNYAETYESILQLIHTTYQQRDL